MTKNEAVKVVRPAMTANGTIGAYNMVKAMIKSGVDMKGTPLAAQLTDAQRTELGL